jgi:hypothetical protein
MAGWLQGLNKRSLGQLETNPKSNESRDVYEYKDDIAMVFGVLDRGDWITDAFSGES